MSILESIEHAASSVASTVGEAASDAVDIVEDSIIHTPLGILPEDLALVHRLVGEVRSHLVGKHPGLSRIFETLYKITY